MQPATPTDNSVLVTLFKHNIWANLRLLDFCEALSEEQLDTSAPGTYGSIRKTLHHMVGGEVSYVQRVTGQWPDAPMTRDQWPGVPVLKQVAQWTGDELMKLALSARADTLVQEEDETVVLRYTLASLMMQAINHATEHRTHVSTILTQLGMPPPEMDGWKYMEDTEEFQETPKTPAAERAGS